MNLYAIDSAIMDILSRLEPDEETGELVCNFEELFGELEKLQMQRQEKLQNIARYILNVRGEISSNANEEARLHKRKLSLEKKEKSLLEYLGNACAGEKTNLGVATVCFRKTESIDVNDSKQAIKFLQENNHENCYRIPEPEVSKKEVKVLIKSGVDVPGVRILQGISCSLR